VSFAFLLHSKKSKFKVQKAIYWIFENPWNQNRISILNYSAFLANWTSDFPFALIAHIFSYCSIFFHCWIYIMSARPLMENMKYF
jgi:hypothetical protein